MTFDRLLNTQLDDLKENGNSRYFTALLHLWKLWKQ